MVLKSVQEPVSPLLGVLDMRRKKMAYSKGCSLAAPIYVYMAHHVRASCGRGHFCFPSTLGVSRFAPTDRVAARITGKFHPATKPPRNGHRQIRSGAAPTILPATGSSSS